PSGSKIAPCFRSIAPKNLETYISASLTWLVMTRTTLLFASLAIALVGCVSNDGTGEYSTPGGNKPTQGQPVTTPSTTALTGNGMSDDGHPVHVYAEEVRGESACAQCTVVHEVALEVDTQTYYGPDGIRVCTVVMTSQGFITESNCAFRPSTL